MSLACVAALGYWLVGLLPPRDPLPTPASVPVAADVPSSRHPGANIALRDVDKPPTPAAVPVAVRSPLEAPKVVGVEPDKVRAGDTLTIRLQAPEVGKGLRCQFRVLPKGHWQEAPDGVARVKGLAAGTLAIEVRTVGPDGRASPPLRKTWDVQASSPGLVGGVPEIGRRPAEEFWQEVVVSRVSHYGVLGTDMGQETQYSFVSRFTAEHQAGGGLEVLQKVEAVRLDKADSSLEARLNGLLQKTRGATYRMTLSPAREVTSFSGDKEALNVLSGAGPLGGTSFLLWSFLDADGWKELAGVSFFRPRQPARDRDRWARPLTHAWGPLGRWEGQVGYAHTGRQAGLERYDYVLDLAYRPPGPGGGGLPFHLGRSDFRVQAARGALAYDPARRRVAAAEELFHVRGRLVVAALGVEAEVDVDEVQVFRLRLHDRDPWKK
jgi:hypothetical protein